MMAKMECLRTYIIEVYLNTDTNKYAPKCCRSTLRSYKYNNTGENTHCNYDVKITFYC